MLAALDLAKAARQYLQAVANRIYFGTNLYKETPAWMCDTKNDRYLGILTGTTVRRGKPTLRDVHAAPSNLPMIRLLTVAATIRKPSRQDFLDDFVLSKFKVGPNHKPGVATRSKAHLSRH